MAALDDAQCRTRLDGADHGILATRHGGRGVDAVPVCFASTPLGVAVPIDTVKPKGPSRLQRIRNLDDDPRAALLVEQWDPDDWSNLWWVRAALHRRPSTAEEVETFGAALAAKYRQYRHRPFTDLLVFEVSGVTGWSAAGEGARGV